MKKNIPEISGLESLYSSPQYQTLSKVFDISNAFVFVKKLFSSALLIL